MRNWGEIVHAVDRAARRRGAVGRKTSASHCRRLIAGYKVPRSIEIRTAPLPLSGSGKVLKTALREPYWREKTRAVN